MTKLVIIGGGPAGLMAAIIAKKMLKSSAEVIILEKNDRVGKKILASGNGHCNFSNQNATIQHYNHPDFVKPVFDQFSPKATAQFFLDLGLEHKVDDEGRMYPFNDAASAVLDVMRHECDHLGVEIKTSIEVVKIQLEGPRFRIDSVQEKGLLADVIIVSTGGRAAPHLGTLGQGYGLLTPFGHKTTETFPAIVPIQVPTEPIRGLNGVRIEGVLKLFKNNTLFRQEKGEILFKENAVSGIASFILSSMVARSLVANEKAQFNLSFDVFPQLSEQELVKQMLLRKQQSPWKTLDQYLVGIVNKMMGFAILRQIPDLKSDLTVGSVSDSKIAQICQLLKDFNLPVEGLLGWQNAQTTSGGLDIKSWHPNTLESKLCPRLFACGELLDIDGECGGFNLQWTWSSGYVAGFHAAQKNLSIKK